MSKQKLKEEIHNVDWSYFNGPPMYESKEVPTALYLLMELEDSNQAEKVGDKLINTLGNNHEGVYYPVVLKALDYVIAIANNTDSKACRICALAVLNDLYYFEPDIEGYAGCSAEELKTVVLKKLSPYSD